MYGLFSVIQHRFIDESYKLHNIYIFQIITEVMQNKDTNS